QPAALADAGVLPLVLAREKGEELAEQDAADPGRQRHVRRLARGLVVEGVDDDTEEVFEPLAGNLVELRLAAEMGERQALPEPALDWILAVADNDREAV